MSDKITKTSVIIEITGENAIDKVYQAQWYMKHLNDENPPVWY